MGPWIVGSWTKKPILDSLLRAFLSESGLTPARSATVSVRKSARPTLTDDWIAPGTPQVHLYKQVLPIVRGGTVCDVLKLQVSEDDADAERLDTLTDFLRRELLQLDVEDLRAIPADKPPPGSRGFDAVAVAGLLVTLGRSVDGLRAVVDAVRNWLARGQGTRRTVRLEIGDDVLELSEVTAADQQRLVDLFIGRHTAGQGV